MHRLEHGWNRTEQNMPIAILHGKLWVLPVLCAVVFGTILADPGTSHITAHGTFGN